MVYTETKIEGGLICGFVEPQKAPKTADKVQVEKATEEQPKTAKTSQKRKQTK